MSSHTLKSLQFTTFKIAKAIIFMNKDKYARRGDKKEEAQRDFWVIWEAVLIFIFIST